METRDLESRRSGGTKVEEISLPILWSESDTETSHSAQTESQALGSELGGLFEASFILFSITLQGSRVV